MNSRQGQPGASNEPPVHCARCASRLMATLDVVGFGSQVIVARRCPECAYEETIVTSVLRAAIWYRHDTRTLNGLLRLADSLRDARMLAVVEPGGSDRSHA